MRIGKVSWANFAQYGHWKSAYSISTTLASVRPRIAAPVRESGCVGGAMSARRGTETAAGLFFSVDWRSTDHNTANETAMNNDVATTSSRFLQLFLAAGAGEGGREAGRHHSAPFIPPGLILCETRSWQEKCRPQISTNLVHPQGAATAPVGVPLTTDVIAKPTEESRSIQDRSTLVREVDWEGGFSSGTSNETGEP
jgi:hypothetical protein